MRLTEFTRFIICFLQYFRRANIFDEGLRRMKTLKLHHLAYLFQGTLITPMCSLELYLSSERWRKKEPANLFYLISTKFGTSRSLFSYINLTDDNMLNDSATYMNKKNLKQFVQSTNKFDTLTKTINLKTRIA